MIHIMIIIIHIYIINHHILYICNVNNFFMKKIKNRKNLIRSLIKDDLINSKLVNSLGEMGLNADDYLLNLSDTIFKLVGIDDKISNEFIFENYLDLAKRSQYINISQGHNSLDNLVEEIYSYLLNEKSKL